jgi:hypothetical protein
VGSGFSGESYSLSSQKTNIPFGLYLNGLLIKTKKKKQKKTQTNKKPYLIGFCFFVPSQRMEMR